ncbi:phosphotransferase [Nocardia mexicana]|uniref:Aminoglycoside phosphotransferase (APT) family kinase protein n=1 Tax=Nocardia mexicana TaxID=279262 RepID=A0A370H046_9NOCA|nr:phosphotransferase [Nocardia mexicana]RDI49304.1 aminoglycoside phosphotransferase (APT) family kinase protein [Nocardia mexicana]
MSGQPDFDGGWDSIATLVDGRWVQRRPRRPEVAEQLLRETRLLPWLAPRLPLAVPVPELVTADPLVVRHLLVPGGPLERFTPECGRALGEFLRALHDCPVDEALRHGVPSAAAVTAERADMVERFLTDVVPLLPPGRRRAARAVLDAVAELPADTVVHGDLGPEHVLAVDDSLTGVIDFGDSHIGDAAIDLAWALHGTPPTFAEAVAATYEVTPALWARALIWHQLGPWHEVTHGLDTEDPDTARSGIAGVLRRL